MKNLENSNSGSKGYRSTSQNGVSVPSRLQLVECLDKSPSPLRIDEICSYFQLKKRKAKISALEGRLGRLCEAGVMLLDRKNRYGLSTKMELLVGKVTGHSDGYGFVVPDGGGDDLYLHHKQMRKVLHGDKVLARVKKIDSRGRKEGSIVEVLIDPSREIVGKYHESADFGFVEPDDARFGRDIVIPKKDSKSAAHGDIVVVNISGHPVKKGHVVGKIIDVVGQHLTPGMEVEIAVRSHDVPHQWPIAVEQLIKRSSEQWKAPRPGKYRKNLTNLPLVTIDGEDARDFDDAVYCELDNDRFRLIVAIADVSHYVDVGGTLDTEAYARGTSVYFPDQVIPMLPELLSNGICSLNPGENRACVVCEIEISLDGKVLHYNFMQALMRSQARLTYDEVNSIVVEKNLQSRSNCTVVKELDCLYQLSTCLRNKRALEGSIDFEIAEAKISFDSNRKISAISAHVRNDAHRLIEECMLVANVCAAEELQKHFKSEAIYRTHDGPEIESLSELRQFIDTFSLKLGGGDKPSAKDYDDLLSQLNDRPEIRGVVQTVLLRSLSQAIYSTDLTGHFALSFPIYTHFTSPIRRYSDLIVHRLLKKSLKIPGYEHALSKDMTMDQAGEHCSFTERRADDASREVMGWLKAEYMSQRIGETFAGVISGIREFGLFVQLDEVFVDGLVHVTNLGKDYYVFDPVMLQLEGRRSGHRYRLGDRVKIIVSSVNLSDSKIDFKLADKPNLDIDFPTKENSGKKRGRKHKRKTKS